MTCEVASSGLIEVTHDASSGHSQHRCFVNDDDDCVCECMGDHDPTSETELQCTVGETLATWDSAHSWQGGEFDGDVATSTYDRNYRWWADKQHCSSIGWAHAHSFWYCGWNANGQPIANYDQWSGPGKSCNLDETPYNNDGEGFAHVPFNGHFCEWVSQTVSIPKTSSKSGIRGLDVELRWKEKHVKDASDMIEVQINACSDQAMTKHCTGFVTAHLRKDDVDHGYTGWGGLGWEWKDDKDTLYNDKIDNHNDRFFQVKIRAQSDDESSSTDLQGNSYNSKWNAYTVDKLVVKVEECEHGRE